MRRIVTVLPLALAGFVAVAGCGDRAKTTATLSRDDSRREGGEAATAIGEQARQQRDDFVRKMEGELDGMHKELGAWREKAKKSTGEAKVKMERRIDDLEKQYQESRSSLGRVRDDAKGAWQELRVGFQTGYDELRKGFERAREEFK